MGKAAYLQGNMSKIRFFSLATSFLCAVAIGGGPNSAQAQAKKPAKSAVESKNVVTPGGGKALELGKYGDWGAYQTQSGKSKICYALAQPKDRQPTTLKRDPAYIFISHRPGEGVRGEVSVIMGFPLKEGANDASADVSGANFGLITKGTNAWVKNVAEETQMIDAMRKGSKLVVKAPSAKGNVTTDTYTLGGLAQALDRVQKECP